MGTISKLIQGVEWISNGLLNVPMVFIYILIGVFLCLVGVYLFASLRKTFDIREICKKYSLWGMLAVFAIWVIGVKILFHSPVGSSEFQVVPTTFHMEWILKAICNVILFIPIGFFLFLQRKNKKTIYWDWLIAVGFSLVVELAQWIFQKGVFDFVDILCNLIGAVLGSCILLLFQFSFTKKSALRILLRVVIILICLGILLSMTAFGTYHILKVNGANSFAAAVQGQVPETQEEQPAELQEGDVYYNGKVYRYNQDTINILCMGIDKKTENIETVEGVSGQGGQADAIFLISLNPTTNDMNIISISRDTMVPIKNYDYSGNFTGESVNHLGLAYSFGDGAHTSCEMMKEAVSGLFYQMPIHGYCAVNLEAIEKLNDAVGGVTVTVPEGFSKLVPSLQDGKTVTLQGEQASKFLQQRDTGLESNDDRMSRQKQYAVNFLKAAEQKMKENPSLPLQMYQELSQQMVTNIGIDQAIYLASLVLNSGFTADDMVKLPGETTSGEYYAEYHVNEDELYQMIIDNYYDEVKVGDGTE